LSQSLNTYSEYLLLLHYNSYKMVDAPVKYDTTRYYNNAVCTHPAYSLSQSTMSELDCTIHTQLNITNKKLISNRCYELYNQCIEHYSTHINQHNKSLYNGIIVLPVLHYILYKSNIFDTYENQQALLDNAHKYINVIMEHIHTLTDTSVPTLLSGECAAVCIKAVIESSRKQNCTSSIQQLIDMHKRVLDVDANDVMFGKAGYYTYDVILIE
jgi:hypothetical protein